MTKTYIDRLRQMLAEGVVIGLIILFWTALAQLSASAVVAANFESGLASSVFRALFVTGVINGLLYAALRAHTLTR